MRTYTKPVRPTANKDPIKASHMANHARCIEELQRKIYPTSKKKAVRKNKVIRPPFWPTLKGGELDMVDGYVILRLSYSSDDVVTILPSDIPNGLSVASGDKITCRIQEDNTGVFTTASIVKTSGAWPVSTAPVLAGGDTAGTAGDRHIRLCEIVTVGSNDSVTVVNTGHIDAFQPSRINNTINAAYTAGEGARFLKDYNAGVWRIREIEKGLGNLTITEDDQTEVRGNKIDTDLKIYIGNVHQTPTLEYRDGLLDTGATVIGDEDPAVAAQEYKIKIPTVTSDDSSVTIVDKGGANGPIYDLSVDLSGALPSGSAGQMLYHNGTTWVVLAAPAAPASDTVNIMTHNGTLPAWVNKDIGTHSVCVSGTPTATDFIEM